MKLLNTYENRDDAEKAESMISGPKRLASERDGTETIYNLFGDATWTNFYKLEMFNLLGLKELIENKQTGKTYSKSKHKEILSMLGYAASRFDLVIPPHWKI